MSNYHYIALNQAQKELTGVIEAPDAAGARAKLNELNLSVVSLNEITATEEVAAQQKSTFEFEALDKNGKKVAGTIVSDDPVKAYARLFDEYQLNVLWIVSSKATSEEKQTAEQQGTQLLHAQYEKRYPKKAREEEQAPIEEQAERKELLAKIDFTMKRVEEFLKTFGPELKPEERDAIQGYINQLIRIKDSTNLEHIRTTCERMLAHLQKQELFANEGQRQRESARLKVETRELLTQLKRTGLQQEIDIVHTAERWQEVPFLKPIATVILKLFRLTDPEVRKLRGDIKVINNHLRSYYKLLVFGGSNIIRSEAWESIKTLHEEKKRLKLRIASIKMTQRPQHAVAGSHAWERLAQVIGWILAFYLLSYILAYPFTIKQFGEFIIPRPFYFYHSTFTKTATLLLFMAYAAVTFRNWWLYKHRSAVLILYPLVLFAFILIAINLF